MGSLGSLEKLHLLRTMLLLRCFESALLRQPAAGFQLLSRGEEAVATGVAAALKSTDPLLCSGRSIAIALARGVPPGGLLAELIGKDGGPNRGRAGRAHVSMPSVGLFGAHGVVGGNLSVAAGVALAQQQLNTGSIVVCLFGDGACGSGALHETLNMAALWRLPLIFGCVNNGYAVSTPVSQALAPRRLTDLALPFDAPARAVDGADVEAVTASVAQAAAAVRGGGGPHFLEFQCTRLATHSTSTRERRSPDELQESGARDPLLLYERLLRDTNVLSDGELQRMHVEIDAEIADAERFAEAAPWPDPESVLHA
jgi:TPP-dependent pyruvate/acetoin dehydrogenase alpha subunit